MAVSFENSDRIETKETDRYGRSLFAKRSFKKDEVVFVAYGAIVKEATPYTIPIDWELRIEPRIPDGNICQYICHSCEPNLGIKNRTLFVAMRDIMAGEEVTIDYAMIGYNYGAELTETERVCECGKPICRGKMGCYKDLSEDLRQKYKGYISDYLLHEGGRSRAGANQDRTV